MGTREHFVLIFAQKDTNISQSFGNRKKVYFALLYLVEYIKYKMNDSNKRTIEQALFVYLLWLKNGMTMEVVFYNA